MVFHKAFTGYEETLKQLTELKGEAICTALYCMYPALTLLQLKKTSNENNKNTLQAILHFSFVEIKNLISQSAYNKQTEAPYFDGIWYLCVHCGYST